MTNPRRVRTDGGTADAATSEDDGDEYTFRLFEPADRSGFLDLYRTVMGPATESWFRWKYERNPYVSHVPVVVAVDDADGIVAARPQVPFRMAAGDRETLALRFGDTIVHPDHRRKGLFTRTTSFAMEYYSAQPTRFAFNFPNSLSEPGYLRMGGQLVQELPTSYRIHDPESLVEAGRFAGLATVGRRASSAARRAERTLRRVDDDVDVVRHERPPAGRLARLASPSTERGVHAVRDERFYRWRFGNPRWSYTTYVAERDGGDVAALVTGEGRTDRGTVTNVMEVLPLSADRRSDTATRALLARVVEDAADSDLIAFAGGTVAPGLLRRFGFLPDDRPPLSVPASPTRHVAYDLGGDGDVAWRVGGLDLRRPESWALTFSEHDSR